MSEQISVKISKIVPSGATAVAVPVFADQLRRIEGVRKAALDRAGFMGAPATTMAVNEGESTRVLVGLGAVESAGPTELRRAAAVFVRSVSRHGRVAIDLNGIFELEKFDADTAECVRAVTEGLILGGYRFDVYKPNAAKTASLSSVTVAVGDRVRAVSAAAESGRQTADAVCFARDLVNEPGGSLTPTVFADRSAARATEAGLTAEILDEAAIREARLGGLIAVNLGSEEPARLLKLTYEPAADDHAGEQPEKRPSGSAPVEEGAVPTVALVGKGITFDSGGLSLKTADSMIGMKNDMGGAAAVISAMCALPSLGVAVRVVSYTPMTDNMTGGRAQRPGDIYTARNGKTVEVLNTDAEGRLVLADALSLATEEEPVAIVDLATLTGACVVALGQKIAGLMGNDEAFSAKVANAAAVAGERVWPLPLPEDYRSGLDSPIADLKNIGSGRYGGTLTAGLFLKEFVGEGIPWVHLDIAGPASLPENDGENGKGATGFGVRTLLRLLEDWETEPDESN